MAMSASRLSAAIKAAILAGGHGATDNAAMQALCDAIAAGVVNEITGHAALNVPGTGLAAPPGGGPVTGFSTTGTVS